MLYEFFFQFFVPARHTLYRFFLHYYAFLVKKCQITTSQFAGKIRNLAGCYESITARRENKARFWLYGSRTKNEILARKIFKNKK
jgi:hypothetical protein